MRLVPRAEVVYGCDGPWWHKAQGLPEFKGTKLAHDSGVCASYRDVHKIEVQDHDRMLLEEPGVIGSGGNSGFQAINLAVQFGATRILLIGFDMHAADGVHWYGKNGWKNANNPVDHNYVRWRNALAKQAPLLRQLGVDVVNASPNSALVCFEKKPLEQALADWRL